MKKKFKIETIGCKTNQYESQAFCDQLKGLGLICAKDDEEVDICIVNACSVTASADKKSINAINLLRKKHKNARFFLTGCFCKKLIENLKDDIIYVPNFEKHNLISYIFPDRVIPKFQIKNFEEHTRAFVKIQDGCNSYCTYCVIPYTRGASRSRNPSDILCEVSKLVDNGYKEIVLTGINISQFNSEITFEELIKEIDKIQGLERIKISSIDPIGVSDKLIEILMKSKKMVSSLHMVLQSGSDKILKKMNRKYDSDLFLNNYKKLTSLNSDFTFTTDVIVGFPSETSEDFENTLNIVKEVKFTKVHIFPYSKRPNTAAASFKEHLDKETIETRKNILHEFASKASFERRSLFIGKEMKVLFENTKDNYFFGHTHNNLLVYVPISDEIISNTVLNVRLIENTNDYILGELCK